MLIDLTPAREKRDGDGDPHLLRPQPRACIPVKGTQPAYAVLDLRAGFDVDRNWRVALRVNNTLDKVYYGSFQTPTIRGWYGAPRNWMLRLDARY